MTNSSNRRLMRFQMPPVPVRREKSVTEKFSFSRWMMSSVFVQGSAALRRSEVFRQMGYSSSGIVAGKMYEAVAGASPAFLMDGTYALKDHFTSNVPSGFISTLIGRYLDATCFATLAYRA